jgi:3-hydroxyacyl-[acyl-carrier-protein] dehydratase
MDTLGIEAEGRLVYFMSIESARFRKPVGPGDSIRIFVEKQQKRGNVWKFKGEARVDGTLMSEATYSAMIMDR